MRFASTTGLLAAALLAVVSAAPSSPPKIPGKCQIETPATPAFNAHPPFAPSSPVMSLRGGAVLEPKTLGEVDGILLKASAEGKLVVIDFSATWCGPCKMIAPLFKELSEDMPGVVFLKVDVDENPDTAAKYTVSAMPTFLFIKKGEVIDRLMGANPAALQEKCSDLA